MNLPAILPLLVSIAAGSVHSADIEKARTGVSTNGFRPLVAADRVEVPILAPASVEGQARIQQFKLAPGMKVNLWAAEPMLANPVAFSVDERGRVFTSETYRYRTSVLDIRHYMFMLEDDLASHTLEHRLALIRKHFGRDGERELSRETEIIRMIEDRDGDGKADASTVVADGFNGPLDGIASGVLARNGQIWFTDIPSLWRFTPTNASPVVSPPAPRDPALVSRPRVNLPGYRAEELARGFGVRFSFTGHDLHGLKFGPDGRLYFSVGDRGAHIVTREGRTLSFPDEGAVFRCEPDGANLEVFARGLRNPQELAFDDDGNLFTGDNDSDQGDRERWVYILKGSDAGWRVGHQHAPLGNAGMWNLERLWVPYFEGQAAYIVPPVANMGDGPSGIVRNPGTGLPARYDGRFLVAYFKGTSAKSGVYSVGLTPTGAGFALARHEEFIWNSLVPDVDIGPDGSVWFADWHEGWPKSNKGRLYKAVFPEMAGDAAAAETRRLLEEGMSRRSEAELTQLLANRDQRVRLEAQWELVARGTLSWTAFQKTAFVAGNPLARVHALWGMGQLGRMHPAPQLAGEFESLIPLTADPNPEVRGQTARLLGESRVRRAQKDISALTIDANARVAALAFEGMAALWEGSQPMRSGQGTSVPVGASGLLSGEAVSQLRLKDVSDRGTDLVAPLTGAAKALDAHPADPWLRHAVVQSLVAWLRKSPPGALLAGTPFSNESAVPTHRRLAAVVAMRSTGDRGLVAFLNDPDPRVAAEAVRAIVDVPSGDSAPNVPLSMVAAMGSRQNLDSLIRRFGSWTAPAMPAIADAIRDVRADQPLPWTNAPVDLLTPVLLRVANANYVLAEDSHLARLCEMAADSRIPEAVRIGAIQMFGARRLPPARDRITGNVRALTERLSARQEEILSPHLATLLDPAKSSSDLMSATARAVNQFPVVGDLSALEKCIRNESAPDAARAEALKTVVQKLGVRGVFSSDSKVGEASARKITEWIQYAQKQPGEALRLTSSRLNAEYNPGDAAGRLAADLESGIQNIQQAAFSTLGDMKNDAADALLAESLDKLMRREIAPEITLDLIDAAAKRESPAVKRRLQAYQEWKLPKDHLSPFRESLVGGDAARGRKIFYENAAVSCTRCHQIGGDGGGNAGPRLDGVATRNGREHLLESVVFPNQQVMAGFESVVLTTKAGTSYAGTVKEETPTELVLNSPEDGEVRIRKNEIVTREKGLSGMPEGMAQLLTPFELRDLMEFLGTLK